MSKTNHVNLETLPGLRCELFSGKPRRTGWTGLEQEQELYRFWFQGWNGIMQKLDGTSMTPAQFIDKDVAISLWDTKGPVGLICATYFPLVEPWTQHSYFEMYSPEFLPALRSQGLKHGWGMQWVYVDERASAKRIGISLAAVLMGLFLRYGREVSKNQSGAGVITMARADVPAAKLVRSWGGSLINSVTLHNVPCEELCIPGFQHQHADAQVNELVSSLWQGKTDHREEVENESYRSAA